MDKSALCRRNGVESPLKIGEDPKRKQQQQQKTKEKRNGFGPIGRPEVSVLNDARPKGSKYYRPTALRMCWKEIF